MDNGRVYLGVWTNWSKSSIMGATLTTTRQQGDLLIAFTAFLIPYVASRFWSIFCLIFHRYYSTSGPRNAIHHQRQIFLRNSSSPESGLFSLFWMLYAWQRSQQSAGTKKLFCRLFPITFFAICCISAFTVAGGLSSRISTAPGNMVLINGDQCGIPDSPNNSATWDGPLFSLQSKRYNDAANYAQQCYSGASSRLLDCDTFVVKKLQIATKHTNSSCPFQGGICRNNETNLLLDTGYIDSNDDLGLNTPENNQFKIRYVIQCAPLITEGYTSKVIRNNMTWVRYHYGDQTSVGGNNRTNESYTWEIEDLDYQYYVIRAGEGFLAGVNYQLRQLFRPDGDLSVMFLSGDGVVFLGPMDDDWYRANVFGHNFTQVRNASAILGAYMPVEAASPLGCLEQWQLCSSGNLTDGGCGPLASLYDALYGAAPFFNVTEEILDLDRELSPTESGSLLVWQLLHVQLWDASIINIIDSLGAKSLSSQLLLTGGLQLPLPLNQWQLDVENWFNIALALFQAKAVNVVLGTGDPVLQEAAITPLNDQERELCNSQKIRSTAYASFSLFGLLFTYITGTLIIITSFILEPILGYLQRRHKYKEYAHLEWMANGTLQLHRLAQEELDCATWEGCTDAVPTTDLGEMMASLDIEDLEHPKLVRPIQESKREKKRQESGSSNDEITTAGGAEEIVQPVVGAHNESEDHVTNGDLTLEEIPTPTQDAGLNEVHSPEEVHTQNQGHIPREDQMSNELPVLEPSHKSINSTPSPTKNQNSEPPAHALADNSAKSTEPKMQDVVPSMVHSQQVIPKIY